MDVAALPWAIRPTDPPREEGRKGIASWLERKEIQTSIKRTVFWYIPFIAPFNNPLDQPISICITVEASKGSCKKHANTQKE
jgi:hypothetical protein